MNKITLTLTITAAIIACSCRDKETCNDRDLYNLRGNVAVLTIDQTSHQGKINYLKNFYFDRHGRLVAYTGNKSNLCAADHWASRDDKGRIDTVRFMNEWCISYAYNNNDTKPAKYKTWDPRFFKPEEVEFEDYTYDKDGNMLLFMPDMGGVENTYKVSNFDEHGNWLYADCREYGEKRSINYYPDDMFEKGSPAAVVEEARQYLIHLDFDKYLDYTDAYFENSAARTKFIEEYLSVSIKRHLSHPHHGYGYSGSYVYGVKYDRKNSNRATVLYVNTYNSGYAETKTATVEKKYGKWVISNKLSPF